MDLITYALCRKLIKRAIESLGNVFTLKGNVDSVENLPATGNNPGDIYLVGPNQDGSYDEYYWTSNGEWEIMGSTMGGLDGVITETTLYKGEDGTGTVEDPAEDTILYIVNSENDYVKKTGDTMTGTLAMDTKTDYVIGTSNKSLGLLIGDINANKIGRSSVVIDSPEIVENSSDGSWANWGNTSALGIGSFAHGYNVIAKGWGATAEGLGNYTRNSVTLSGAANSTDYTTSSSWKICKDGDIIIDSSSNEILANVVNVVKTSSQSYQNYYIITLDKTLDAENAIENKSYVYLSSNAIGNFSHTEGEKTIANGECSHAEGKETIANGQSSHAEGEATIANGNSSHAEGNGTTAKGRGSHAEGYNTLTGYLSNGSHAEGRNTASIENYSHAEGYGNANNFKNNLFDLTGAKNATTYTYSTYGNETEELNNFLQTGYIIKGRGEATNNGWVTITAVDTSNSTVTVDKTLSSKKAISNLQHQIFNQQGNTYGIYSHAEGNNTQTWSRSQHAAGEYNLADMTGMSDTRGTYAYIIGNGTADNNRSNAHTVKWDGEAWFAKDVYVGSTSGTHKDEGSKKLLTELDIGIITDEQILSLFGLNIQPKRQKLFLEETPTDPITPVTPYQ